MHETGLKRRDEDEKDRFNCFGDHACRSKYQRLCVGCKEVVKQVLQDQEGEDEAKEEDKKAARILKKKKRTLNCLHRTVTKAVRTGLWAVKEANRRARPRILIRLLK